jgi:hypothetical protein
VCASASIPGSWRNAVHPRLTTLANAQNVGERLAERLGSHSHFQARLS